jgi:hypothetical protein
LQTCGWYARIYYTDLSDGGERMLEKDRERRRHSFTIREDTWQRMQRAADGYDLSVSAWLNMVISRALREGEARVEATG